MTLYNNDGSSIITLKLINKLLQLIKEKTNSDIPSNEELINYSLYNLLKYFEEPDVDIETSLREFSEGLLYYSEGVTHKKEV